MADTKISALPAAASLGDTDELVLNVAGANKKITGANLKASMPAGGGGALVLLNTVTLAAPGIFDVSGIPQTYNDLICILIGRSANSGAFDDGVFMRLNNDAATNYYGTNLQNIGTNVTGTESNGSGAATLSRVPKAGSLANSFGVTEFVVFGYTSTVWLKSILYDSYYIMAAAAASMGSQRGGATWKSTVAVNQLTLGVGSSGSFANFVTGSQLRIYGRL